MKQGGSWSTVLAYYSHQYTNNSILVLPRFLVLQQPCRILSKVGETLLTSANRLSHVNSFKVLLDLLRRIELTSSEVRRAISHLRDEQVPFVIAFLNDPSFKHLLTKADFLPLTNGRQISRRLGVNIYDLGLLLYNSVTCIV